MEPIVDAYYDGTHGVSFYECTNKPDNPIGAFLTHTWKNLFLIPLSKPVFAAPTRKVSKTELLGADGEVDSSSALTGYPLYNNRTGSFTFYILSNDYHTDKPEKLEDSDGENILDSDYEFVICETGNEGVDISQTWSQKYSQLMDMFNGRELVAILDDDPEYYYRGYFDATYQSGSDGASLTINYDVDPYKIRLDPTTLTIKRPKYKVFKFHSPAPKNIYVNPSRMPVLPEFRLNCSEYNDADKDAKIIFTLKNTELNKTVPIELGKVQDIKLKEYKKYTKTSAVFTNNNGHNTIQITPKNSVAFLERYKVEMRIKEGDL